MDYKRGDKLAMVIVDGISWAKEGDMVIFLRNSSNYEDDKGIGVMDESGKLHFVKEYRVAEYGNKTAIARCKANAPKLYVVLQDSCRNYVGSSAKIGLDEAEKFAMEEVNTGEPLTVYELVAVKSVSREPVSIVA